MTCAAHPWPCDEAHECATCLRNRVELLEIFVAEVAAEAKRCQAAFRDMSPRFVLQRLAALAPEEKPRV